LLLEVILDRPFLKDTTAFAKYHASQEGKIIGRLVLFELTQAAAGQLRFEKLILSKLFLLNSRQRALRSLMSTG